MNCDIFEPMNFKSYLLLFVLIISPKLMSQNTSNEVISEQERLNKFNIGWAYYGRGNGVSFVYDRELSELFSVGLGSEFYFIDEEREFSYFVVGDLHLKELLELKKGYDIYPGFEVGSFESDFGAHFYVGVSKSITPNIGLYTEIGTRGILGLYYNF